MPTMFFNHLYVTGPADAVEEFKKKFRINGEMIDVDDGAAFDTDNPDSYDEDTNYKNHKAFIDFIRDETGTRFDRIRLCSITNGININFDSWGGHAGAHVSWMAENCPSLRFSLSFFNDPHSSTALVFENGKWEATEYVEGTYDDPYEELEYHIAGGNYQDYSDFKLNVLHNLDEAISLDAIRQAENEAKADAIVCKEKC